MIKANGQGPMTNDQSLPYKKAFSPLLCYKITLSPLVLQKIFSPLLVLRTTHYAPRTPRCCPTTSHHPRSCATKINFPALFYAPRIMRLHPLIRYLSADRPTVVLQKRIFPASCSTHYAPRNTHYPSPLSYKNTFSPLLVLRNTHHAPHFLHLPHLP
jgi:hypothetical protein